MHATRYLSRQIPMVGSRNRQIGQDRLKGIKDQPQNTKGVSRIAVRSTSEFAESVPLHRPSDRELAPLEFTTYGWLTC